MVDSSVNVDVLAASMPRIYVRRCSSYIVFGKSACRLLLANYRMSFSSWDGLPSPRDSPVCYESVLLLRNLLAARNLLRHSSTFKYSDLEIEAVPTSKRASKPEPSKLVFGKSFSDHMFEVGWSEKSGWGKPRICPLHNFLLHPAAKVLHYAQEIFEGMKAFRTAEGKVKLFRPEMNIKRMLSSCERIGFPSFSGEEFYKCLLKLISIDKEWTPNHPNSSLYIRPAAIGTEPALGVAASNDVLLYVITGPTGPYFATGIKPVSLLADPRNVRAWPGGTGDKKLGCNYAPTLSVQKKAESNKCHQVLWLFGEKHEITEVGAMNVFVYLKNERGENELVTPPLSGIILPGITRQSVIDLVREWKDIKVTERKITMEELVEANQEKRLYEMFGCGTACVICPVERISFKGKDIHIPTMNHEKPLYARILKAINDIQYGIIPHKWSVEVD